MASSKMTPLDFKRCFIILQIVSIGLRSGELTGFIFHWIPRRALSALTLLGPKLDVKIYWSSQILFLSLPSSFPYFSINIHSNLENNEF